MLTFSRALARRLRSVLRRAVVEQEPRGEWPLLVCRAGPHGLALQARRGEVGVCFHQAGALPPAVLAFRSDVLAGFEGRADEPVTLTATGPGAARACWADGGAARELDLETVDPAGVPPLPPQPATWSPQPAALAAALAEAAAVTAASSGRYALSRVQLRGRAGQVVATDGRQLLVRGGFRLPWQEDLLVPRLPALALRELRGVGPAAVGRTDTHVWLRLGPWAFCLLIDHAARFPDHTRVIPNNQAAGCRLRVTPADAALLVRELPRLPGDADESAPVTLDLGRTPAVRARDRDGGPPEEVVLAGSTAEGPPLRVCLNRVYLRRALQLGFTEAQFGGPDQPVVWRDGPGLYLCVPLDPNSALPPGQEAAPAQRLMPTPRPPEAQERRQTPMAEPNSNGHADHAAAPGDLEDLVTEAEELRRVLQESAGRAARLAAALKQQRRQGRAVQAALAALRQLQPGPPPRRAPGAPLQPEKR